MFLRELNIPKREIQIYEKYHYGKEVDENGNIIKKYTAKELKEKMEDEIKELNKILNKPKNIIKAVDRFVTHGINTKYDISALITGTPENFTWIKTDDIYEIALSYANKDILTPHFGMLYIQPKQRNFSNNIEKEHITKYVQIKWHNLNEEILDFYHQKKI